MFARFRYPKGPDSIDEHATTVEEAAARMTSELGDIYRRHSGRPAFKWIDYIDLYDRHLSSFRETDAVLLELGVLDGGSLEVWRDYLGPDATICGIDINPDCADRVDAPNIVRIGSQADPDFLAKVVAEIGQPSIIIDDGSHIASHQLASFVSLWPTLAHGGLYVIEDMQTAYWSQWEGGYKRPGTAVSLAKDLIDAMHGWWHKRGGIVKPTDILAVHQYESILFIEKGHKAAPKHFRVG